MKKQKKFTNGRNVYAKIRVEDNAILSRSAQWPTLIDDEPIVGDDGSIKYLPVFEDEDDTEIDSDLFVTEIAELVAPDEFYVKRSIKKRNKEELKQRAENYEATHRADLIPQEQVSQLALIGIAILLKKTKNLNLSTKETNYIDAIVATASKLEANNARLAELKAQIEANQDPDLKAGWVKNQ